MTLDDQFQVAVIIDKLPLLERFQERSKAQNQGVLARKSYNKTKDRGRDEKT